MEAYGMSRSLAKASVDRLHFEDRQNTVSRANSFYRKHVGPNRYRGDYILDEDILDDFRLMPNALRKQGFLKSTLRHFEVGFDAARCRITYPIRNIYGELVGISGRTVIDEEPRYKIYKRELQEVTGIPEDYTLERIKKATMWHAHISYPHLYNSRDPIVVTEGFKAAMWLWQCGIDNVVALIGSSMSQLQANLLTHCGEVFLFLDNNEAGILGTAKAGSLTTGTMTYVAKYPDLREQPDDLDKYEIRTALKLAEPFTNWRIDNVGIRKAPRRSWT